MAEPATVLRIISVQSLCLELLPRPRPVVGLGGRLLTADHAHRHGIEYTATEPILMP